MRRLDGGRPLRGFLRVERDLQILPERLVACRRKWRGSDERGFGFQRTIQLQREQRAIFLRVIIARRELHNGLVFRQRELRLPARLPMLREQPTRVEIVRRFAHHLDLLLQVLQLRVKILKALQIGGTLRRQQIDQAAHRVDRRIDLPGLGQEIDEREVHEIIVRRKPDRLFQFLPREIVFAGVFVQFRQRQPDRSQVGILLGEFGERFQRTRQVRGLREYAHHAGLRRPVRFVQRVGIEREHAQVIIYRVRQITLRAVRFAQQQVRLREFRIELQGVIEQLARLCPVAGLRRGLAPLVVQVCRVRTEPRGIAVIVRRLPQAVGAFFRVGRDNGDDAVEAREVRRVIGVERIQTARALQNFFACRDQRRALGRIGLAAPAFEIRAPQKERVKILGRLERERALVHFNATLPQAGAFVIQTGFVKSVRRDAGKIRRIDQRGHEEQEGRRGDQIRRRAQPPRGARQYIQPQTEGDDGDKEKECGVVKAEQVDERLGHFAGLGKRTRLKQREPQRRRERQNGKERDFVCQHLARGARRIFFAQTDDAADQPRQSEQEQDAGRWLRAFEKERALHDVECVDRTTLVREKFVREGHADQGNNRRPRDHRHGRYIRIFGARRAHGLLLLCEAALLAAIRREARRRLRLHRRWRDDRRRFGFADALHPDPGEEREVKPKVRARGNDGDAKINFDEMPDQRGSQRREPQRARRLKRHGGRSLAVAPQGRQREKHHQAGDHPKRQRDADKIPAAP